MPYYSRNYRLSLLYVINQCPKIYTIYTNYTKIAGFARAPAALTALRVLADIAGKAPF